MKKSKPAIKQSYESWRVAYLTMCKRYGVVSAHEEVLQAIYEDADQQQLEETLK